MPFFRAYDNVSLWPLRGSAEPRYQDVPHKRSKRENEAITQAEELRAADPVGLAKHREGDSMLYSPETQHIPRKSWREEYEDYEAIIWRKGLLYNAFPCAVYFGVPGFAYGMHVARLYVRHQPRPKVILQYTAGFAMAGFGSAAIHHVLVVMNDYKPLTLHSLFAGGAAGLAVSSVMNGIGPYSVAVSALVSVTYTMLDTFARVWKRKQAEDFFNEQQAKAMPLERITPELRSAYKAYQYDNRPVQKDDPAMVQVMKRNRDRYSRPFGDDRLDAVTTLETIDSFWLSSWKAPEWFPFKMNPGTAEEEDIVAQRQREDDFIRKKNSVLMEETSFAHPTRSPQARELVDRGKGMAQLRQEEEEQRHAMAAR